VKSELFEERGVQKFFAFTAWFEVLGDVHDERGVEAFDAGGIKGVVKFNGGDDGFGNSPEREKISADVCVGGSENSHLGLLERNGCFGGKFDREAILGFGIRGENQFTNIVEQTRKKTFFRLFGGQTFGESDFARSDGCGETVRPEVFKCFSREAVVVVKGEGLKAEGQRFEDFDASQLYCFSGVDDLAFRTEVRGVDDVEKFGAEPRILFDDRGDFAHVDVR